MAPKRAAAKAAPPPPPAESSDDETQSRSRSEDSEDEEALAESPIPAPTPVLKNTPAPSQKGDESESSDEEEEEEEENDDEEEEEPAPAAPKNQPPPPQKKDDSDASGSDEEEDPTRTAPPSSQKKQPQKKEDPDTSGDEEDEDEDEDEDEEEEAPPPKPAPKKEAPPPKPAPKKEAEVPKPPAAAETKKPGAFERIWSTNDDVRILEALAAHRKQHGTLPQPDALVDVLAGKLDNRAYGSKELQSKVKSLRFRYLTLSKRGELPSKEHDRRVLELSKLVWTSDKTSPVAAAVNAANGHEPKGFEEMCELYPNLAEEVKGLEAARPGMCKREFGKMDDEKARSMDEKIKKQRVVQIKVEMRHADLIKEVTKALVDLVDA
ncbi:hypothetical protein ACQ4PT_069764 [Festuca glaucescens]